MKKPLILLLLIVLVASAYSQVLPNKELTTRRTSDRPKIGGDLTDGCWQDAESALFAVNLSPYCDGLNSLDFFRAFYSPDYNKTFLVDVMPGISLASEYGLLGWYLRLSPHHKVSNHLNMIPAVMHGRNFKDIGYVTDSLESNELTSTGYFRELFDTLEAPASNLISLKILYYLGYQYFKRIRART